MAFIPALTKIYLRKRFFINALYHTDVFIFNDLSQKILETCKSGFFASKRSAATIG